MATLINNAGVQHYANKMVLAENRKVGSKSLPTALNDIDNLIDEMKAHFDTEYGSALDMKLENNENVFSVGTGTNVDKRSEVENSFTDVELSGNSLVNITHPLYPMHIKWTHEGTWKSKFILCADAPNINADSAHKKVMFNPRDKTTYTIVCNVIKNTSSANVALHNAENTTCMFKTHMHIKPSDVGILKFVQTADYSGLDMSRKDLVVLRTQSSGVASGEIEIADIMILEGDWTNKPIPQYFEGMKSVGQDDVNGHKIEILSQNKNLVSGLEVGGLYPNSGLENPNNGTFTIRNKGYIKVEPNTTYTLSIEDNNTFEGMVFHTYDINKKQIGFNQSSKFTLTTPNNAYYLRFRSFNADATNVNTNLKIQLEKGNIRTSYVPYSINKKEISLNEPLRGLPNGVKDTIEKVNGEWKIVRRCGEVTLNGSETSWNRNTDFNGTEVLFFFINTRSNTSVPEGAVKTNGNMVHLQCDSFPCYPLKDRVNNKNNNIEGIIYSDSSNPLIQFHINKSKLASEDLTGFKQWLSQNPTKVIYELATPIIENISPITLQCWKNGTISIDEVLPVETTHTVALNKPAQIKRNIEELTVIRKRVQALEEQYDQIALEQAHQLSLINHSIELDYNI